LPHYWPLVLILTGQSFSTSPLYVLRGGLLLGHVTDS